MSHHWLESLTMSGSLQTRTPCCCPVCCWLMDGYILLITVMFWNHVMLYKRELMTLYFISAMSIFTPWDEDWNTDWFLPAQLPFYYNFPLQRSYYSWCLPISGGKNSQHLRLLSPITCDKDHKILGTAKHLQPWRGQPAVLRERTIASDFEVLFFSPATSNLAVLSNTPHSDCTKRS